MITRGEAFTLQQALIDTFDDEHVDVLLKKDFSFIITNPYAAYKFEVVNYNAELTLCEILTGTFLSEAQAINAKVDAPNNCYDYVEHIKGWYYLHKSTDEQRKKVQQASIAYRALK